MRITFPSRSRSRKKWYQYLNQRIRVGAPFTLQYLPTALAALLFLPRAGAALLLLSGAASY
jgi:hypothetical protein